jgi:hypothetical protein
MKCMGSEGVVCLPFSQNLMLSSIYQKIEVIFHHMWPRIVYTQTFITLEHSLLEDFKLVTKVVYFIFIYSVNIKARRPSLSFCLALGLVIVELLLKWIYSGRESFTHMIDMVPVKCGITFFLLHFCSLVFRIQLPDPAFDRF